MTQTPDRTVEEPENVKQIETFNLIRSGHLHLEEIQKTQENPTRLSKTKKTQHSSTQEAQDSCALWSLAPAREEETSNRSKKNKQTKKT